MDFPPAAPEDSDTIEVHTLNTALTDRASACGRMIVISHARQADSRHCATKILPSLSPGAGHGPRVAWT